MNSSQLSPTTLNGFLNVLLKLMRPVLKTAESIERHESRLPESEGNSFRNLPRILVVDDHKGNRLMLAAFLAQWSIAPIEAVDGAEAVALACGHRFDLILMDLQMPILDGLVATAQIRSFERKHLRPRAPIVAYSSSILASDWPSLRACGFDESLDKPCSDQSLAACLMRWCGSDLSHAIPAGLPTRIT